MYVSYSGIIYRDLKPENVLIQGNGDISLSDFDLSCLTSCRPQVFSPYQILVKNLCWRVFHELITGDHCNSQLLIPRIDEKKKKKQQKNQQTPVFMAEPMRASNSFVGTEEYIAPVSVIMYIQA